MDEESKRIQAQRNKDTDNANPEARDEALNPTSDAIQTGREHVDKENSDENKAARNPGSYESEFGSKKAGPGGYGDRASKPLTDRKRDQDAKERQEEFDSEDKEKAKRKETTSPAMDETKKHGDKEDR